MRTVRDGGVLPNGTPWVLYETESRNAAREGAASNLYVGAENEWRASVATTPFRGLSRVWDFAGRGPSSELALFEHPLHEESSPKRRAGVRLWRNGRVESEHELGGALPGTRDFAVLADADGHFVAGGVAALFQVATDADVPFTLWFVAADRREVRTLSFEDVRLPPVADPMRTVRWGIHFESQESFVVWRRGHTRWRFRYDAGSAAWSHLPEPMATPEEKILDDFADDSKRRVLFVKTTTAGSTWVVVAVDGVGEQLLTTAHLAPECFER